MRLNRVEIYGFKSFAQRTELSFDRGITGIVGPNGSGKSNIADAVRWVLGEQSAKTLRGARMEDVIFSGTQQRKALPYCEVSLQFDNEDRELNSPYAEVLVTRRVYRNGESEYSLNKSNCRLKDVLELFRDTGIGKEGYSIIGQGRIEEILSSKGEERRAVFEEAAGIVTYRVRKEESERKLARTRENLLRVGDLMDELGARLGPLEEQARTAQEYLSLSERLKMLEINAFLQRHDRLKDRLASLATLSEGLRDVILNHEQQLQQLSERRQQVDQELETLNHQESTARENHQQAQRSAYEAQAAVQAVDSRIQQLQDSLQRLCEQQEQAEGKRAELTALLEQGEEDSQAQLQLDEAAQAGISRQEALYQEAARAAEQAEEKLNAHRQRIVAALTRLSDVKSQQARQQAMLQQMEKRREELQKEQQQLLANRAELQQGLAAAQQGFEAVEVQLDKLQAELAVQHQLHQDRQQEMAAHQRAARSLADALQSRQGRLNVLEEMARDYEGYNLAVKRALQHAQGDPGVHGVVAQLIKVPRNYETAIEMILGGSLQHIVTSSEEDAKEMINYLRANRLGRTTFLPISAIRSRTLSREESALLGMAGCLGVASELVDFDPAYRGIVENLLGRTVIVENLDVAIALSRRARQSFNVVTLAGDVMRAGGAMTGGAAQGRVSSLLGRGREIDELKQQILADQEALAEAQRKANSLQDQLNEAERLFDEASEALNQERIALARETERRQHAQQALDLSNRRIQDMEDALLQLSQASSELKADLAGVSEQTSEAAVNQDEMEAETLVLQQALQSARQLAETERNQLMSLTAKQAELKHQRDMLLRDRSRLNRELESLAQGQQRSAGEMSRMAATLSEAKDRLASASIAEQAARTGEQERQQALKMLEQQREQRQATQRSLVDETEALHALHKQDSDKLHRNELVESKTQGELQSITEHIFNSYELTYAGAEQHRVEGKFELPKAEIEIRQIRQRIREMGSVNVSAIEDFATTKERYSALEIQRDDALRAQEDLEKLIEQLLSRMAHQFKEEFEKLKAFFSQTFRRLFGGGQAELRLSDPEHPLTCDIDIAAQPPGKKLQLLSLLSGGERALTAIAILFAMLKLKPTPFCILDEIEAALDDANINHFADYLAEYAQSTQFIVITHRKGTMERCDVLYGVSMQEKGVSSMVSVDLLKYA